MLLAAPTATGTDTVVVAMPIIMGAWLYILVRHHHHKVLTALVGYVLGVSMAVASSALALNINGAVTGVVSSVINALNGIKL